jgi:hypothetical protein
MPNMPNKPLQTNSARHRPWEIVSTQEIYSAPPWITVSLQTVRLPDGRLVPDYHQVQMPDYAVVYAETLAGKIVVERQYKHGLRWAASFPIPIMAAAAPTFFTRLMRAACGILMLATWRRPSFSS